MALTDNEHPHRRDQATRENEYPRRVNQATRENEHPQRWNEATRENEYPDEATRAWHDSFWGPEDEGAREAASQPSRERTRHERSESRQRDHGSQHWKPETMAAAHPTIHIHTTPLVMNTPTIHQNLDDSPNYLHDRNPGLAAFPSSPNQSRQPQYQSNLRQAAHRAQTPLARFSEKIKMFLHLQDEKDYENESEVDYENASSAPARADKPTEPFQETYRGTRVAESRGVGQRGEGIEGARSLPPTPAPLVFELPGTPVDGPRPNGPRILRKPVPKPPFQR